MFNLCAVLPSWLIRCHGKFLVKYLFIVFVGSTCCRPGSGLSPSLIRVGAASFVVDTASEVFSLLVGAATGT